MSELNVNYGFSVYRPQSCISVTFVEETKTERFKRVAAKVAFNVLLALVIASLVIAACVVVSLTLPMGLSLILGYLFGTIGTISFIELKR